MTLQGNCRRAGYQGAPGPSYLPVKHERAGVSANDELYVIEGMRDGNLKKAVTGMGLAGLLHPSVLY
jgi:hypothetical protein